MTWVGPIPTPPGGGVLTPEARRHAWEIGQSAPRLDDETRSALALLLRPMAESLAELRKTAA